MLTGNRLFNDPLEVFKYALTASSSPLPLDDIGLSFPCLSFLRDILRPVPEDRPSAEDCQKNPLITNEVAEPEYSIGNDLYSRLSKTNCRAPNVDSFPDMVANRAVGTVERRYLP